MLRSLVRNAVTYSGSTFARMLINFVVTPILIRALGAAGYGIWSFVSVFSINGYLTLLSLGLQATLIRDLAAADARGDRSEFRRQFYTTLLVYTAAGAVGALALITVALAILDRVFNIPADLISTGRLLLVLLAMQTLIDFPALALDGVIVGRQQYGLRSILETARFAAFGIAAALATVRGAGPAGLGVISLLTSISFAMLTTAVLASRTGDLFPPVMPRMADVVRSIKDSTSMFAIRINSTVFAQMDRTVLGILLNTTTITHYDIAARINGFAMLAQNLPASVILPAASAKAALGARDDLRRMFVSFTRYTAMVSTLVVVGLAIVAEPFIRYWIGPEYAVDAPLAQLFLVVPAFWMFTNIGWNIMVAIGRIPDLLRIMLSTTALNLATSVALTLSLGLPGVILGTALGNAVAALLYIRLFIVALDVPLGPFLRDVVLRPYVAAVGVALPLIAVVILRPPSSLIETGVYFGGYCAIGLVASVAICANPAEQAHLRDRLRALAPGRPAR